MDGELDDYAAELGVERSADDFTDPVGTAEFLCWISVGDLLKAREIGDLPAVEVYKWMYAMMRQNQRIIKQKEEEKEQGG